MALLRNTTPRHYSSQRSVTCSFHVAVFADHFVFMAVQGEGRLRGLSHRAEGCRTPKFGLGVTSCCHPKVFFSLKLAPVCWSRAPGQKQPLSPDISIESITAWSDGRHCDAETTSNGAETPCIDHHQFSLKISTVQENWHRCLLIFRFLMLCAWPDLEDLIYNGQ